MRKCRNSGSSSYHPSRLQLVIVGKKNGIMTGTQCLHLTSRWGSRGLINLNRSLRHADLPDEDLRLVAFLVLLDSMPLQSVSSPRGLLVLYDRGTIKLTQHALLLVARTRSSCSPSKRNLFDWDPQA